MDVVLVLLIIPILHSFWFIVSSVKLFNELKQPYLSILKISQWVLVLWISVWYIVYFMAIMFFPSRIAISIIHALYHPLIIAYVFINQAIWMTLSLHWNSYAGILRRTVFEMTQTGIKRKEKRFVIGIITILVIILLLCLSEIIINNKGECKYNRSFSSIKDEDSYLWKTAVVLYSIQYPIFLSFHIISIFNEVYLRFRLKKSIKLIGPFQNSSYNYVFKALNAVWNLVSVNIILLTLWLGYYLSLMIHNLAYFELINITNNYNTKYRVIFIIQLTFDSLNFFIYWLWNLRQFSFTQYIFYLVKDLNKLEEFDSCSIFIKPSWLKTNNRNTFQTTDSEVLSKTLAYYERSDEYTGEIDSYSLDNVLH